MHACVSVCARSCRRQTSYCAYKLQGLWCICACACLQVAKKLPRIQFKGYKRIGLLTGGRIPASDQPQALHTALPLITHLHTPGIQLELSHFTMSDALAAEVSAAHAAGWDKISFYQSYWRPVRHIAPRLPPLHTLNLCEALTDELLSTLHGCVTAVDTLRVMDSRLTHDVPAGTVLPWRVTWVKDIEERVQDLSLVRFLRQVRHMGADTTTWALDDFDISFDTEQVSVYDCTMHVGEHGRLPCNQHACTHHAHKHVGQ